MYGYILLLRVIHIISFNFCTWILAVECVYASISICTCVLNSYWNSISDFLWPFESKFVFFSHFLLNSISQFSLSPVSLSNKNGCEREWVCVNVWIIYWFCLFYTCFIIIRANVLIWLVNQGTNSNNISEVLRNICKSVYWNERHAVQMYST